MNGTLAVEGPQLVITKDQPFFDTFINQFKRILKTGMLFNFSENNWQKVLDEGFR